MKTIIFHFIPTLIIAHNFGDQPKVPGRIVVKNALFFIKQMQEGCCFSKPFQAPAREEKVGVLMGVNPLIYIEVEANMQK